MNRIIAEDAIMHPAADLFPKMTETEFSDLVEDIRQHGQREPVWVNGDGHVIDGKHRVLACAELGRSVEARTYNGDEESIAAFVVSLNLKRRHLSESQCSVVGAKVANLKHGTNQYADEKVEGSQDPSTSIQDAANAVGVSTGSIKRARKVIKDGTPELLQAVEDGILPVSVAAKVADLTPEQEMDILKNEPGVIGKVARQEVAKHEKKKKKIKEHNESVQRLQEAGNAMVDAMGIDEWERRGRASNVRSAIRRLVDLPDPYEVVEEMSDWDIEEFQEIKEQLQWVLDFSLAWKERIEKCSGKKQ